MSCRSSTSESSSSTTVVPSRCTYCARSINNDDFLTCQQCQGNVHIKCLRHASTPGDLLGDVFFDFTCCKCNDDVMLQFDGPSTSSSSTAPREKLVRQRLPWVMVITLALHNLSIKSKGLSHHGYFHWRTHIVSFIDKNWDFLFEPMARRRKKWIGSVSGALSHNSPDFFLSGQEVFNESGWWKLTQSHLTPKYIFKIYEKQSLKRQQTRCDKRSLEEPKHDYPIDVVKTERAPKRIRQIESEDEIIIPSHSCSRTIPYMGRKPKIAKQLNIVDVDNSKNLKQQQLDQHPVLNTVQSSLMDFLAENLASEDLMFQDLPNIVPEPIVSLGKNDEDLLQLIRESGEPTDGKNIDNHLFEIGPGMKNVNNLYDPASIKHENNESKSFNLTLRGDAEDVDGKLKRFYLHQEQQLQQRTDNSNIFKANESKGFNAIDDNEDYDTNGNYEDGDVDDEDGDDDDNAGEDDDEEEEFKPRIVQVTNFQEIETSSLKLKSPAKTPRKIKKEVNSDVDTQSDDEDMTRENCVNVSLIKQEPLNQQANEVNECDESSHSSVEERNKFEQCKPSLFSKRIQQRNWPWLMEQEENINESEDLAVKPNESIVLMSKYEEQEMLQKLHKIMSTENKCKIEIPSYVRRFYRKLCVRAWKRDHSKPLFNLDDFCDPTRKERNQDIDYKTQHIDRYQLLCHTTVDARSSFYARIAGSFHYELFESPYSQRILHPFIFRSRECFPPWLKLMCELQYTVNKTAPSRSSIDYCYVRPNHIAAVNALLQSVFWPGIDMTECLSYPDFSVVALYKKLVIGCGFLVPDVGYNEAYISFMAVRPGWQRSGIATFMLYHLIQTCMSKDITLHVSATNPAVMLYQKFGFKIEEVILDFYDKYLPLNSKHSRHAFFLRLMR